MSKDTTEIGPEDVEDLNEKLADANAIADADQLVASAEAKVEKQKAHLAGAEEALKSARAARKELN